MGYIVYCVKDDYLAELFKLAWAQLQCGAAPLGYGFHSDEALKVVANLVQLDLFELSPNSEYRWYLTEHGKTCRLDKESEYFRVEIPLEDDHEPVLLDF